MYYWSERTFGELVGKTLTAVAGEVGGDEMLFATDAGEVYKLYHHQDCCENVSLNDIEGDLADLIGSPIVLAEEAYNSEPQPWQEVEHYGSFTWTFYRIATAKGFVVLRWYGESNGYYSEGVDFALVKGKEELPHA